MYKNAITAKNIAPTSILFYYPCIKLIVPLFRRMPRRRSTKIGRITPPLDVRNDSSLSAFENLIINGPLTVVLVYADWCGHCTKFKEKMWNKATNMPNKTINTASVHYDMLDKTSLKNSKIEGYPSLLLVGTDKKPADFQDESTGAKINAMPMPQTQQDLEEVLTTPVTEPIRNANSFAKNLTKSLPENTVIQTQESLLTPSAASVEAEPETVTETVTEPVVTQKNAYIPTSIKNLESPPNTLTDLVETQTRNRFTTLQPKQAGGSLLASLLEITRQAAPSGILLTAASAYASRRKRRSTRRKRASTKKRTAKL